jgi:hypothetical protein
MCPFHPTWTTYAGPQMVLIETYEAAQTLDFDDDCPVQELTEQEMKLIGRLCHERDPIVQSQSFTWCICRWTR